MSNINNNLGIYNDENNDSTEFNLNNHILQGIEFNNYSKLYEISGNVRHNFLENSSSEKWGSIVEAFNGDDSISKNKQNEVDFSTDNDDNDDELNKELNKFATEYKTYASSDINHLDPEPSIELMSKKLDDLKEGFGCKKREGFEDKLKTETIRGKIETSALVMNSMYYHYFVYFIITVTLLSFTFNIMVNPNANVMNAMFVVGALLLVFFISRKFGV
jgi:hypothetical protein